MTKQITSILITLTVLTGLIVPATQRPILAVDTGTVTGVISNTTGCYVSGRISSAVQKEIDDLKKKLRGLIPTSPPIFSNTVPVSDKKVQEQFDDYIDKYINKNYRDNILARCLTMEILRAITGNTANIVRTRGRDGGTTAITNWTNFLTKAQYRGENIFRAQLSTAKLCGYLSDNFKKSFGVDPKKKTVLTGQNARTDSLLTFSLAVRCTMPSDFTLEKYQDDFVGNGGWDAFSRMLEPQNNVWGLAMLSQNEIAKQRSVQQEADTNQAIANKGYIGISGNGKNDSCRVKGPTGECLIYKDIKTTGTYLAEGLAAGLNAEYAWLTSGDAIGNIIANLASSLTQHVLNKFMNFSNPDQGGVGGIPLPTDTPGPSLTPTPSRTPGPGTEPESLLVDVQAERTKYGTPMTPAELGKLLNGVAWKNKDAGWMLVGKTGGNNCPAPSGELISCDFLVHQPTISGYDVLASQETEAIPVWDGPDPSLPELISTGARTFVAPTQP